MIATQLRLLQYNVASHTRKGEIIKQQLVQTALQQGLCDLALVQGCTGIHEPVRSGTGGSYQPATNTLLASGSSHCQAGTMFCYIADRFRVGQLSSIAEDLPGFVHSILLVQDISTSTSFIAIVLASDAHIDSAPNTSSQLAKLWHLMKELSTQCSVLAAGDCTLSSAADSLCSDSSIQVYPCQPVRHVSSISQSFFATARGPKHQIQITDVESLLARPAAASAQYTQNAHTAICCITCEAASGQSPQTEAAIDHDASANQGTNSSRLASSSNTQPEGSSIIAAQLRVLVNAASTGVAEILLDARQPCNAEDTPGVAKLQRPLEAVHLTASCSSSYPSRDLPDKAGRSMRIATAAPLTISYQSGESEIEPKPPTPAYGRAAVHHQLTQTSSGNLCFAGMEEERHSHNTQDQEEACSTQAQTPAPFQPQPNPTSRQLVDISTLRIMQLRRSISELSTSCVPLSSEVSTASAAMTSELNAMLSQQRVHQQAADASADDIGRLSPNSDVAGMTMSRPQEEQADPERQGRSIGVQGDGLYAAAKQAPGDLKAAWHKHVQHPVERKGLRKQVKGRSSEEKMSSPGRLLKCLHSRTDSDVEAEMEATKFRQ